MTSRITIRWKDLDTQARCELFKEQVKPGQTARQIVDRLHYLGIIEVTRNAVIGHISRHMQDTHALGEPGKHGEVPRPKKRKQPARTARVPVRRKAQPKAPEPVAIPIKSNPKPLIELSDRDCRYILSEEPNEHAMFCGARKQPGSSFCPHHHSICWETVAERRRSRAA